MMASATAEVSTPTNNYGDVALSLPPDWSRSRIAGSPTFVLTTVGHESGIPDAFLTEHPSVVHQFRWADPADGNTVSILRTKHYQLCNKSEWSKNPSLWEFDGEGRIIHNGQALYARDRIYYDQDKEDEDARRDQRDEKRSTSQEEERTMRTIESRGGTIEDERGRPLRPHSPQKQR